TTADLPQRAAAFQRPGARSRRSAGASGTCRTHSYDCPRSSMATWWVLLRPIPPAPSGVADNHRWLLFLPCPGCGRGSFFSPGAAKGTVRSADLGTCASEKNLLTMGLAQMEYTESDRPSAGALFLALAVVGLGVCPVLSARPTGRVGCASVAESVMAQSRWADFIQAHRRCCFSIRFCS